MIDFAPQPAPENERRQAQDHAGRKIVPDQIPAVAGDEIDAPGTFHGLGAVLVAQVGARAPVENNGVRAKHSPGAGEPGAQKEIDIFEIGEITGVQLADFAGQAFSEEHGGAGGEKNLSRPNMAGHGLIFRNWFDPGLDSVTDARAFDLDALGGPQHEGGEKIHFLVLAGGLEQALQPVRLSLGIVIEQRDQISLRLVDPRVHGSGKTFILGKLDYLWLKRVGLGKAERAVGGAVVHHDGLEILRGLGRKRIQARAEKGLAVIVRYDHGKLWEIFYQYI